MKKSKLAPRVLKPYKFTEEETFEVLNELKRFISPKHILCPDEFPNLRVRGERGI